MSGTSERAGKRSRQKLDLLIRRLGDKKKTAKGAKDVIPVLPRGTSPAHFQLSFAQQRLWLLDQLHPGSPVYNIAGAIDLIGDLDSDILRGALGALQARHEALRTTLVVPSKNGGQSGPSENGGGEPRQLVAPAQPFVLPQVDLTDLPEEERRERAERLESEEARKPFDLAQGPLLRATLVRLQPSHHRLLVTLHHAVADGWSLGIVLRELATLYDAELHGRAQALADLPVQYVDVASWQRQTLQGDKLQRDLDYWRQRLDGVSTLELPTDRSRPAKAAFRGKRLPVTLEAPLASSLRRLAQAQSTTLFTVLETAFAILMARLSGQEDVAVGMPVAGRRRKEMEGLVGLFVNTLVLRHQLRPGQSFLDLLASSRDSILAADAHQDVPFEKLVEELQPERHLSTTPFFQVAMAFEAAALAEVEVGGLTWRPREVGTGTSKFDLTFNLGETAGADGPIQGSVELDLDLFDVSTVERWWQHYQVMLEAVVGDASTAWDRLPLLGDAQRRQLVTEWNGQPRPVDLPEATICGLVAQQAQLHPSQLAIVDGESGAGLTYGELEKRSNRLAHHLIALGAEPETLVGVCMERSVDLVVALLAVLKSGAAYLPLDLAYPTDRLAFMLEDSGARWLLSESALAERLPDFHGETLLLDADETIEAVADRPSTTPEIQLSGGSLAYVIYTSGSTGKPKGVLIPHGHVARLLAACDDWFSFGSEDRWTFFHSHAFDFSVWEIWGALATGGRLVVVPYWVSRSPDAFYELLADQGVTVLNQTPSAFRQLVEVARHGAPRKLALREVIFGGEALDLSTLRPWFELFGDQQPRLVNMYGITETTVHVTFRALTAADAEQSGRSPVGEAIPDLSLHIVDAAGEVQPVGVAGEMWVGGAGLARGYLGRPGLTAERFVPHPFSSEPGARAYRSGDLARYLPDGDIDFMGRIDHQVKLRGFRIELGEIEARLQEQAAVAEAAVLVQEIQGDGQLVAYWVPVGDLGESSAPTVAELRERLGEHLPDYMIPAFYVQLDTLPLTANGKLDRRALPLPDVEAAASEYVAPRTPTESTLCAIWAEILGVERVGVHDDFFALGGHSLLATQIMARLRQTLGVDVPLRHLFEGPTVGDLATVVDGLVGRGTVEVLPFETRARAELAPLSFAQERLWFLDQLEPGNVAYNIPAQLRLRGSLDVEALRDALGRVVERHEILRTVFRSEAGQARQVVLESSPLELPLHDLSHLGEGAAEEATRRAEAEAQTSFDLVAGPLLRGHLLRLAEDEHRLIFNLHHIVADGWSIGVLLGELAELYEARLEHRSASLPPLPVQYSEVAQGQRQWFQDGAWEASLEALRRQLADVPVLELPTDRPRPAVARQRGGALPVRLDAELSGALERLAEQQGVTTYILLLAAFGTLLSRLTQQQDLTIGSPVANRRRVEMEGLIGCFVNTVVQRLDLSGTPTFEELVQRTRRVALASDEHQDVPFEQVVAAVEAERQLATSPLFQVMLVLQTAPFAKTSLPGLELEPLPVDSGTSKFDLTLALGAPIVGSGEGLEGHLEYDSDLFDEATIQRWWVHFKMLLTGIVEDPSTPLWQLPLLHTSQRRQLLLEWNTPAVSLGEGSLQEAGATLADLFAVQVAATPEAVALRHQGMTWTYRQLADRVWYLAGQLQDLGVGPDRVVGVCLDRRPEMIVAMLAAQAAGGAYVPLDPNYPAQRLAYILEDTAAPVILTRQALEHILPPHEGAVIRLDDAFAECPQNLTPPKHGAGWENLAHLIYTSGSTGRPKGVAITHRSTAILVHWARRAFSDKDLAGMLVATSINFDLSVFEIFVPLCSGGTLILAENALELPTLPDRDHVRLVNTVPSAMAELVRQGGIPDSVRTVNLAGEPLRRALVDGIYAAAQVEGVYNLYGPSEDTTYSTYIRAPENIPDEPTIGQPMPRTQAYVLDRQGGLVLPGAVGELFLGGEGLARGYLGRAALTAERFVPDHLGSEPGARLYRTGDLVRHLPSSELLFLGRLDHQVKIRGFRIELGEIESSLLALDPVRDTVVMARQDHEGDPRLVAYVTGDHLDADLLRSQLAETLPDYMLPSAFVMLDALPLLPNGKVNRKALPAPDWSGDEAAYVAPRNDVESTLATLWQEVLGVERVGVRDNFFALGGHSLLATQMMTRLRRHWSVDLPLRLLFEAPTVADLAAVVRRKQASTPPWPALVPRPEGNIDPLSFAQERLWFLDQLDPGSVVYNIPARIRMLGDLDAELLKKALQQVAQRHEVLRTVFRSGGDNDRAETVLQVVQEHAEMDLPVHDLTSWAVEERESEAIRLAQAEATTSFDLEHGPLWRASLLKLSPEEHQLILNLHHIVADGWSVGVLLEELVSFYGGGETPQTLPVQYGDYALWQRQWFDAGVVAEGLAFWQQQLDDVPVLELPTDRPRPAVARQHGAALPVRLDAALSQELKQLSERHGVTLYMLLLAAYGALLSRLTNQHDLTVGSPVANRRLEETEGLIGCFINTLVQRLDFSGKPTFEELLHRTRRVALASDEHQDVPFEQVVAAMEGDRQLATSPLFQTVLVLQNAPFSKTTLPGLELEPLPVDSGTSKFDLTLALGEAMMGSGEGLEGHLEYDTDLFDEATIQRWWGHFEALLQGVVADAERPVASLPLLSEAQRRQLVTEWNGQPHPVDLPEATICGLVAQQAQLHPSLLAIVDGESGAGLTYGELEKRSNRLAHHLIALGAEPETLVGVCMERSVDLVVALLAVLKSGAAYLPLDLAYPTDRLAFMLEDSGARWLLSESALAERLPDFHGETLLLDADETVLAVADRPSTTPEIQLSGGSLAYVIYTSGSTGKPKGVLIPHGHVARLLAACDDWFSFGSEDRWTFFHSHAFDFSVWEIWGALATGGRLVVVPYWVSRSPDAFYELLADQGVTVLNQTPSAFRQLVEVARHGAPRKLALREVIFGGEALDLSTLRPWFELFGDQQPRLVNMYGITETTVHVTFRALTAADAEQSGRSPVGEAIPDLSLHIVDAAGEVQPVGVAGEMWVGGAGLARGYLGRPGLTAERFVPHPFSSEPGARAYRSGDLARYLPDGDIDFMGRIDHQVKLRGFRIELGEIEARLQEQAAVAEAAVLVQEIQGDGQLVAYWVPVGDLDESSTPTVAELRERLGEHLPDYMIPAFYVQLDTLPLTANGKLDRRALPLPDVEASASEYVAPRTPTESTLCAIWAETLGVERVGVHDGFFALGGHSLLATRAITQIRQQLNVDLPLRQIFEAPTVAELASRVDAAGTPSVELPALEASGDRHSAPLSFPQERLWFLDQLDPGRTTYNIPAMVQLQGNLRVDVLQRALDEVVARHDILRTVLRSQDDGVPQNGVLQIVLDALDIPLPVDDLRSHSAPLEEGRRRAQQVAEQPFDLARGPLLRGRLLRVADDNHWLVLVQHHVICDGWSVGVLLSEITALYGAFASDEGSPLQPLPVQYVDFSRWQRQVLSGDLLETQLDFWRQTLEDVPILELPTDRPRPMSPGHRGALVPVHLDGDLVVDLRQMAQQHGVSLFMVLLATYGAALSRLSGQRDVAIGHPIANRREARLEGLLGMFVNTLVARLDLSGRPDVATLLQRCRSVMLDADAHQDVPFEKVVAELQGDRKGDRTPLFQAALSLQNMPFEVPRLPDVEVSLLDLDNGTSKFDLTLVLGSLDGEVSDRGLSGVFEYDVDLFDASTVERWRDVWVHLLRGMLASPGRPVETLSLLDPAQQQQVMDLSDVRRGPYPREAGLAQIFRQHVQRAPQAIALSFQDAAGQVHDMTYGELDASSDRLACELLDLGVSPEELVGLCAERSLEMIIAHLAILKAGGAYLPLEPSYPEERLAWMMEDAEVRVLLAQQHLTDRLAGQGQLAHTVLLDGPQASWKQREVQAPQPDPPVHGRHLAYLMYTSGSTGRPKGVAVEQRGVSRLVLNNNFGDLNPERVYLGYSPISFDAATLEIWGPLLKGARLVLAPPQQLSVAELATVIERHRVDILFLTVGLFHQMADDGPWHQLRHVRQWYSGGDVLSPIAIRKVLEALPDCRFFNAYGPTENSTVTTSHPMDHPSEVDEPVSIGRPIINTGVQILDPSFQPMPVGVSGQLCASGDGLARGYHKRPALTAEKWIPDPLSTEPGGRIYLTGDRARYLSNGELEFQGRIDRQVKVRGFRIEPGEVELQVAAQPEVRQTAVVVLDDPPRGKRLVAFVVPHEAHRDPALGDLLRQRLGEILPAYMVPSAFQVLDEDLPLDKNAKVDRKALAKMPVDAVAAPPTVAMVAPRNAVEEQLAALWCEVLGLPEVSVEADFFELGGHSLLATQIIARMRQHLGVEVPLRHLFEDPTVSGLAKVVESLAGDTATALPPVERRGSDGPAVLSYAQERLWFLDQLEPGSAVYNIPAQVRLRGRLDVDMFRDALNGVVGRHESLRTVFHSDDEGAHQVILDPSPLELPVEDLSHLGEGAAAEADRRAVAEAETPFDLAAGPLLRGHLLRLAEHEHQLILNMHHIISDGWSVGVLLSELGELYAAQVEGREATLVPLPVQYADVAVWQRQWLQGDAMEASLEALRQRLADAPVLELPTDRPRPAVAQQRGKSLPVQLNARLSNDLSRFAEQQGVTPYILFLAAFGTLLSRLTNQDDLTIGSPVANRRRVEMEGLIGCFVNTLVQRLDFAGQPTFEELLQRTRRVALASDEHQDVPFERVVAAVEGERQLATSPLFQAMLVLQNAPVGQTSLPGLELEALPLDSGTSKFDLTLALGESLVGSDQGYAGNLEYDADLFDAATMVRWWGHFEVLLQGILEDPARPVWQLPLISQAQRRQLLVDWNPRDAAVTWRQDGADTVTDLFAAQVERTPDADALCFQGTAWTYRELARRVWFLAHRLQELGVGPDRVVGVCLDRRPEMIVAMLAAQAAGGAYVPLDPNYPAQRLGYILEDTAAPVILTRDALRHILPDHQGTVVCLDEDAFSDLPEQVAPPVHGAGWENLAHLIYTSGSTGRPKGVAIAHRSSVILMHWTRQAFSADDLAGMMAATSINFDLSVFEILAPLCWGGTVILAENALELPTLPDRDRIRLVNTVPSAMAELVRQGGIPDGVRTVNLAGEPLRRALVDGIYAAAQVEGVYNLYGPSEDTTYSTYTRVPSGTSAEPTIGRPLTATQAYILDAHLQPVPLGVVGELYLGGDGIGRGYLGRPGMTAERFVPDHLGGEPGARLYRTGDLVRYLPSSEMLFLGRVDHQVKIRGFRIELGEIESALLSQPEVRDTVVMARQDREGVPRLVAYVTSAEDLDTDALRHRLTESLPEYMLPSAFVVLDAMPLLPNGKINRKALPAPEWRGDEEAYVAPRDAAEESLVTLWQEVLDVERVGVHDNFFSLGGHSLLATQVITRVRQQLGVELPLRQIFEAPTVAGLAQVVQELQGDGQAPEEAMVIEELGDRDLRLSFAQERLWLLDRFEPGNPAYNMPFALRLKGDLDSAVLQASLGHLVARHEILRTIYADVDGYPVQHVLPRMEVDLPLHDLSSLEGAAQDEALKALAAEDAQASFDLAAGPVFRARLARLSDALHVVLFNIHHIASDGWSLGILTRDLGSLYAAEIRGEESQLPALPVRYADYASWQRRWLDGEVLERQLGYWKQQLADLPASLELPTDRPRPAVRSFTGDQRTLTLDSDVVDGLKDLSQRHGATLFMTVLSAFEILLSRLSGQVDLAVGTPIAGRQRREVENLVGIFLNTLVLRGDLSGNPSFEGLLERVRETTLGAYGHQDLPFEKLLDELKPERDMARTPFFQVFFNMINMPLEPLKLSGLAIEPEGQPEAPSKFDLTVYAREDEERLSFQWVFNSRLFDAGRIEEMLAQYNMLLRQLAQNSQTPIDQLSLRTPNALEVLPDPTAPLDDSWRGAVHEHLTQRAQQHPERLAVRDPYGSWTYQDLENQSNRLAHWLRSVGVDSEDPVAILAHRSASLVWTVQGVLKSGGAFVLLDPAYPAAHLVKTVERAKPKAWLQLADAGDIPEELETTLAIWGCPRLILPPWHTIQGTEAEQPGAGQPSELATQPETAPALEVGPDDLAYISFTSGSTGVPKGILGRHGPLTHFLPFQQEQFGLEEDDVYSMLSGLAHDPLQRDMFTPICLGASLTIPQPERMFNAGYLAEWMLQEKVTIAHMTPAMGQVLTEPPPTGASQPLTGLRYAFITGDVLTQRDVVRLRRLAPDVGCTNSYGSTETQRAVAFNEAPKDLGRDSKLIMPLGKGMRDVQLLVINRAGDLAGIGELGEVWLRSPHLSRGYLGDAELTADRFLVNPFQQGTSPSAADRVYRTGDLGRYLADGTVIFAGRADQQVKIRGFRIELGEIEGQLAQLPGVREAVVQLRGSERKGGRRLLALLVRDPSSDVEASSTGLRQALRQRLPEYMVPAGFVFLERLPLTPNGKLDRRALAQIDDSDREIQMAFKAPRTEMEVALADILKDVLQVERVGADDNFFDLGGNSLLLVQFNNRIQQLIGREIQAVEIFNHPTVASLATFLTQTEGGGKAPVEAVVEDRTEQLKSGRNRLKARLAKRRRP